MDPAQRPFDGLKVIDCASFIAAPAAATILSDFGADVDQDRAAGRRRSLSRASDRRLPARRPHYDWQLDSRNKRSLAIDLKHADGLAVLHRLVAGADVFVTNLPLPVRRAPE